MVTRKSPYVLVAVLSFANTVFAQLTNTVTSTTSGNRNCEILTITYSNWTFTDSAGVAHIFPGTDQEIDRSGIHCNSESTTGLDTLSTDSEYRLQARGGNGTATLVAVKGFINPKYVVLGVTYAPPGPNSNVTYTNSALVGNTTTVTDSFQNDVSLGVSVEKDISAWSIIGGAGVKLTGTSSTDYIQGSNSSSTTTISKQTSVAYKTNGTANAFSPISHDYDTIWLWLNPVFIYTVGINNAQNVIWKGYGYDNSDLNGMDVFGVQVGWLNGHFGVNPSIQAVLARSWASAGKTWPAGEGPGLTAADIATILQADPFTDSSYVLPSPLPSTSADRRFTQIPFPPNPINYEQAGLGNGGGTTATYSLVNTNSSSVANGSSHSFKQSFAFDERFSGGIWFAHFTLDLKQSNTTTWTHTFQNTLTTTTTLTNALSITGPGCPQTTPPCVPLYVGPGEFIAYQDNLYGTFMFYPVN
jgi:hypothetical protein